MDQRFEDRGFFVGDLQLERKIHLHGNIILEDPRMEDRPTREARRFIGHILSLFLGRRS